MTLGSCAGSNCAGWEPIRPSHKDVLSEETAKQILSHDEFGASQRCPGFTKKGSLF